MEFAGCGDYKVASGDARQACDDIGAVKQGSPAIAAAVSILQEIHGTAIGTSDVQPPRGTPEFIAFVKKMLQSLQQGHDADDLVVGSIVAELVLFTQNSAKLPWSDALFQEDSLSLGGDRAYRGPLYIPLDLWVKENVPSEMQQEED